MPTVHCSGCGRPFTVIKVYREDSYLCQKCKSGRGSGGGGPGGGGGGGGSGPKGGMVHFDVDTPGGGDWGPSGGF